MSLRKATVRDLDRIVLIDHAVLKTNWHEHLYLDEIVSVDSIFNVLELEGSIIGFIVLRKSDTIYEILQLAITTEMQGLGFGSILLEHSTTALRAEAIFLEVSSHNQAAQKLYLKNEFEALRIRKNYYGPDEDAIVMRKRLI